MKGRWSGTGGRSGPAERPGRAGCRTVASALTATAARERQSIFVSMIEKITGTVEDTEGTGQPAAGGP